MNAYHIFNLVGLIIGIFSICYALNFWRKRIKLERLFNQYSKQFEDASKRHAVNEMVAINDHCEAILEEMRRL